MSVDNIEKKTNVDEIDKMISKAKNEKKMADKKPKENFLKNNENKKPDNLSKTDDKPEFRSSGDAYAEYEADDSDYSYEPVYEDVSEAVSQQEVAINEGERNFEEALLRGDMQEAQNNIDIINNSIETEKYIIEDIESRNRFNEMQAEQSQKSRQQNVADYKVDESISADGKSKENRKEKEIGTDKMKKGKTPQPKNQKI